MNTTYVNAVRHGTREFWVGLSSTEPAKDSTNVTEPAWEYCARTQVTNFTDSNEGFIYNVDQLAFVKSQSVLFPPEAKAAYLLLFDDSGADANLLQAGMLKDPKTIESSTRLALDAETIGIVLLDCEHAIA